MMNEYIKNLKRYDKLIFNLFCKGNGLHGYVQSSSRRKYTLRYKKLNKYLNIKFYLANRFSWIDAASNPYNIGELLYCIDHKIETQPTCKTCGQPVHYRNKVGRYSMYCNQKCQQNSDENKKNMINTLRSKYTPEEWSKKISDAQNSRTKEQKQLQVQKRKDTYIRKYGSTSYFNIEKFHQTSLERFGVTNYFAFEQAKQRRKKYCEEHGLDLFYASPQSRKDITKKAKERWAKDEAKEKQSKRLKEFYDKQDDSYFVHMSRLAAEAYQNMDEDKRNTMNEKRRNTIANKSQEEKDAQYNKIHETTKKNGNIGGNKSNIEGYVYSIIKSYFPDAIHGYTDDRYARKTGYRFNCDIYIPSIDVFIECQYHQSHGLAPYEECNDEKNKESIDYILKYNSKLKIPNKDPLNTFLISDPLKRNVAKEHNLRYYELWNKSQINAVHRLCSELKEKYVNFN